MIRLALAEMRRAPRRFAPLTATLAAVMFLALSVNALADGLLRASTGALRNTDADIFVFADGARTSVFRSILPDVLTIAISHQSGVRGAGALGFVPTAVRPADPGRDAGGDEVSVVAVSVSHGLPGRPLGLMRGRLPFDGEPRVAAIDSRLVAHGFDLGDHIVIDRFTIEVIGIIDDASYLLRPTVWLPPSEFAVIRNRALPEFDVDESLTSVIAVQTSPSASLEHVRKVIDEAFAEALIELEEMSEVQGGIEVVTAREAWQAIPGVAAQQRTLRALVVVVLAAAAAIVGVFMSILAVERRRLHGNLLAIGVRSRTLAGTVLTQAVVSALVASALALMALLAVSAVVPESVPLHVDLRSALLVITGAGLAAAVGSVADAWQVIRRDPADALRSR